MPRDARSSKKPPLILLTAIFSANWLRLKLWEGEKKPPTNSLIFDYPLGFFKMHFFLNEAGIDRSDEMGHVEDKASNQHI